jgi:hypothetical protein
LYSQDEFPTAIFQSLLTHACKKKKNKKYYKCKKNAHGELRQKEIVVQ